MSTARYTGWLKEHIANLAGVALAAALLANLGMAAPTLGISSPVWLGNAELSIFHRNLGERRIRTSDEIILITIREETPRKLGLKRPVLPLPRWTHAQLIHRLREAGARALVLDLLFLSPSVPEEDEALREALATSAPLHVTLATEPDPNQSHKDLTAPGGWRYYFRTPAVLPKPQPANVKVASATAWDPEGRLRGAILLRPDEKTGTELPHLALSCVLGRYSIESATWDREREVVRAGSLAWPVGGDGEALVRWTRSGRLQTMEYADALAALNDGPGRHRFRNKIVLVGDFTGADVHSTDLGRMHGAEFVGHMVSTLLLDANSSVDRWRIPANFAWGFLLALWAAAAVSSLERRIMAAGVIGAAAAVLLVPRLVVPIWVDTFGPGLSVILAVAITGAQSTFLAGRFIPHHVRTRRPEALTETASVMFVDLRGSSAMAERLGAERAQSLQGQLLEGLSAIIARYEGEVERTLGDGLMAVFRRRAGEDHALRCLRSVSPLLQEAARIGREWNSRFEVRVGITIGIEAGVVSGRVLRAAGTEEWSSFGPTVNLAARLQGACGDVGASVLLGPGAWALARHEVRAVSLGAVPLKGFEDPVPIYSVIVDAPEEAQR